MNPKWKERFRKLWRFAWKSAMWFVIVSVFSVILFRWVPIPVTPLMLIRCVQQKWDGKPATLEKDWVSLDQINNNLQLAVVCCEDQNFLKHHGFDFDAIDRAQKEAEDGGKLRGASTISQQTAKNVFLWPGRSWIRKGFEAWFTLLIEIFWSKERIMEVYLNVVELGDGIYGAEAAAQHYFGKHAKDLSASESALLAVILPSPLRYSVSAPGPYVLRRQSWALQQMGFWGGTLIYHTEEKEDKKETPARSRKRKNKANEESTSTKIIGAPPE